MQNCLIWQVRVPSNAMRATIENPKQLLKHTQRVCCTYMCICEHIDNIYNVRIRTIISPLSLFRIIQIVFMYFFRLTKALLTWNTQFSFSARFRYMSYPSRSFPTKRNKNIWNFEYTVTGNRILLRVMNFRNKLVPDKRGSTVYYLYIYNYKD